MTCSLKDSQEFHSLNMCKTQMRSLLNAASSEGMLVNVKTLSIIIMPFTSFLSWKVCCFSQSEISTIVEIQINISLPVLASDWDWSFVLFFNCHGSFTSPLISLLYHLYNGDELYDLGENYAVGLSGRFYISLLWPKHYNAGTPIVPLRCAETLIYSWVSIIIATTLCVRNWQETRYFSLCLESLSFSFKAFKGRTV